MAVVITPPFKVNGQKRYFCSVDFNHTEYTVQWSGSWQPPSLVGFPNIAGVNVEQVQQSAEKQRLWHESTPLDYGSCALIRIHNEQGDFPVIKLAHHGDAERLFIRNEFDILKSLTSEPVVRLHDRPLSDESGLFGIRMQMLQRIGIIELAERSNEVKEAVKKVHAAGVAMNDISISNVMLDRDDNITLIDFGFAGKVGTRVPPYFPLWKSKNSFFSIETDDEDLTKMFNACTSACDQLRQEGKLQSTFHFSHDNQHMPRKKVSQRYRQFDDQITARKPCQLYDR
jgi:Protein kinase domain